MARGEPTIINLGSVNKSGAISDFLRGTQYYDQLTDRFLVYFRFFETDETRNNSGDDFKPSDLNNFPWAIANITLPTWNMKKEITPMGVISKSFPVLAAEGHELTILFEEFAEGGVSKFITWCQRSIFDENGFYKVVDEQSLGDLIVDMVDVYGTTAFRHTYKDVYYLNSTPPTADRGQTTTLQISITFGCDNMWTEFFNLDYSSKDNVPN